MACFSRKCKDDDFASNIQSCEQVQTDLLSAAEDFKPLENNPDDSVTANAGQQLISQAYTG